MEKLMDNLAIGFIIQQFFLLNLSNLQIVLLSS